MKDPNNPLKRRAAAAGLTMVDRTVIPSTRRAHEAAEFARTEGKLDAMCAALLRRYWSEGQDLWALATLRGAAQDVALDPDELERAIAEGTFREAVEARVRDAQEVGVRAVPTFLFDGKLALEGAQEYPVFQQVMRKLGAPPRA